MTQKTTAEVMIGLATEMIVVKTIAVKILIVEAVDIDQNDITVL